MDWKQIIYALLMVFIAWLLYRQVRANPQWFSLANFNQTARTLGLLALLLIAFIGLCMWLLG
ncbi:hypothetical protein BH10PSE19_BH10PSE19_12870 [soil metagenome]